jgi:hypothetical protein
MRINERYILSLTSAFALGTFALALFDVIQLDLYISVYIIEYFIITLLHSPLKPRAGRILDIIGYALFVVFVVIVALRVWDILFGFALL